MTLVIVILLEKGAKQFKQKSNDITHISDPKSKQSFRRLSMYIHTMLSHALHQQPIISRLALPFLLLLHILEYAIQIITPVTTAYYSFISYNSNTHTHTPPTPIPISPSPNSASSISLLYQYDPEIRTRSPSRTHMYGYGTVVCPPPFRAQTRVAYPTDLAPARTPPGEINH